MNSNDFIAAIGKPEESPEVQALLRAVGVKKKLKMPKDDIEARVDLPKKGLSLVFEPADSKSNALLFSAVQFFSTIEKGFKSFGGDLPCGLTFADTQKEALKKLGKPVESKKMFRLDRWKPKGLKSVKMTVEYGKDDPRIAAITVERDKK
jgi:hypothetical protein